MRGYVYLAQGQVYASTLRSSSRYWWQEENRFAVGRRCPCTTTAPDGAVQRPGLQLPPRRAAQERAKTAVISCTEGGQLHAHVGRSWQRRLYCPLGRGKTLARKDATISLSTERPYLQRLIDSVFLVQHHSACDREHEPQSMTPPQTGPLAAVSGPFLTDTLHAGSGCDAVHVRQ